MRGCRLDSSLAREISITAETYCQRITEMRGKLKIQQPALINRYGSILLNNNARPYISRTIIEKLNTLKYEIL